MWFIGVEVEQETSAPPPKKKILDPPLSQHFKTCQNNRIVVPILSFFTEDWTRVYDIADFKISGVSRPQEFTKPVRSQKTYSGERFRYVDALCSCA